MSEYVSIAFEGVPATVFKHLNNIIKINNVDCFQVDSCIYLKADTEEFNEINLFRTFRIDELTKYLGVNKISEEDFKKKRELSIENQRNSKYQGTFSDKLNTDIGEVIGFASNVGNSLFDSIGEIKNNLGQKIDLKDIKLTEKANELTKKLGFNDILNSLNDTILPSKQPLHKDDPFNFLISKEYVGPFILISFILILFINSSI